jgi:Holliday junction resolvase-like predicted endonuclease
MEITSDQHGNTILVITEGQSPGHAANREPQMMRLTIPQHGGPWACVIRDANGNPVTGLWIEESDLRELAREISENLPLPRREPRPAPGITTVDAAADYLRSAARMMVLDRNWCCDAGGLSVIASDRGQLVAVYLRMADSAGRFHRPLHHLPAKTAREMRMLAGIWVRQQQGLGLTSQEIRIDVLGLSLQPPGGYTIEHVRNVLPAADEEVPG